MFPEALSDKAKKILPALKNFDDFYLAGGTALALQIGHRRSFDFDLFSNNEISAGIFRQAKKTLSDYSLSLSVEDADELTFFADEVKITFLRYSFPVLLNFIDYEGIRLLSVKEISATKAYTVGRRGSYKDYIDLYFILREKCASLKEIIDLAEAKYNGEFNSRLFLEQLVYLEDIQDTEIVFLKNEVDKKDIEKFFQEKIGQIM